MPPRTAPAKLPAPLAAAVLVLCGCSNSRPQAPMETASDAVDGKGADATADEAADLEDSPAGCADVPDTVDLAEQALRTADIQLKGFAGAVLSTEYNVTVKGSLNLDAAGRDLSLSTRFDVVAADPPNARDKAETEIRKISGTRKAEVLGKGDRSRLGDEWKNVLCAVWPVERVEETTGAHATIVAFDPPLPYLASPTLTKTAFARALPGPVTFTNIRAKVISTTNDKIATGQMRTGAATFTPIDPSRTIEDNAGRGIDVAATYAYRVQFDFGDATTTSALGLQKSSFYYVKGGKFVAISVETGVADVPMVHFFP